jgi:hypothetical protein
MKVELGHRYIISNPRKGDSDYGYSEVEVIALSPSQKMAKFKTDAGVLFWEFINDISVKEELTIADKNDPPGAKPANGSETSKQLPKVKIIRENR